MNLFSDKKSMTVSFPPSTGWALEDDDDYFTYQPQCSEGRTDVTMLVRLTPEAGFTGNFRVILAGGVAFKGQMGAGKLLPVKEAAEYDLSIEVRPEEICLRPNGVTSDWFDVDQR